MQVFTKSPTLVPPLNVSGQLSILLKLRDFFAKILTPYKIGFKYAVEMSLHQHIV